MRQVAVREWCGTEFMSRWMSDGIDCQLSTDMVFITVFMTIKERFTAYENSIRCCSNLADLSDRSVTWNFILLSRFLQMNCSTQHRSAKAVASTFWRHRCNGPSNHYGKISSVCRNLNWHRMKALLLLIGLMMMHNRYFGLPIASAFIPSTRVAHKY